MGKRKIKMRTGSQVIKNYFCNYCGKSVMPEKIIWGWDPGPSVYCSDSCKNKLAKKKVSDEASICSNVG